MAVSGVQRTVRGLAKVSFVEINRELARRRKLATRLTNKRAHLLDRVAEVERQIRECGVSVNGAERVRGAAKAGSPRGGRSSTLAGALASLLKGRTMSVTDMSEAVQKAGYRTNSPNFRVIVNAALLNHTGLFRRVGRGQYTAR